ncbi:nicotinate phosphoribosyltransferase [Rhodocytophaga aerolata]|uniref:Nicotinate phosphoribosyltransferase n=1 Tax=Rhodocytophaga aerolata TaxID=455078 RepID=A0ABT8R1J7_9BACT|nr:nicotinate phosphoribosyltransferase [Rhodocytophaga aerolata]MDO1445972.1 nicotinate phosphoribosyltransferase [Rhodocytophaga aerolata]
MNSSKSLYHNSLTLLTDLYQLTMAYGYWKSGMAGKEAVFNMFFRRNPFQGGYTIACGLAQVIEYLQDLRFAEDDLAYLATLRGNDGQLLFEPAFLEYLQELRFTCDIDAIPEGTVVFPQEPMLRIKGPILQCQLLETPILNMINFQSLIATKAARIGQVVKDEPILEFGLRRAQGIDGGVTASRAAYIGGCAATSNVLAGKLYGIPVKGTHAHSWIMSFDTEEDAFETYAEVMPNNCVFLVDTYDTLEGVKKAIEVGKKLRAKGYKMAGIRLDSGDLAYLSIESRKLLDAAGFTDASILASNDLDEHIIFSLKNQGATINVWGVGTKLVTAYDQPALGGVYKLAAIRNTSGGWDYKLKLSEQAIKISTPGIQQVRRYFNDKEFLADMIYDTESFLPQQNSTIVDPMDYTKRRKLTNTETFEDLLIPVFRQGQQVYTVPPIEDTRLRVKHQLGMFHEGIKRFSNPHIYPVGLEKGLYDFKTDLILQLRNLKSETEEV